MVNDEFLNSLEFSDNILTDVELLTLEDHAAEEFLIEQVCEHLDFLAEGLDILIQDPKDQTVLLKYFDQDDNLIRSLSEDQDNLISATEALNIKIPLELEDTAFIWKMLRSYSSGFARRLQDKLTIQRKLFNDNMAKFPKEIDKIKHNSVKHGTALELTTYKDLINATKALNSKVPIAVEIIKNPSEYTRILRSFNFDKNMMSLGLKLGKFVAAGKNKQKTKQLYQASGGFSFDYTTDRTLNQLGYPTDSKSLKSLYDEAAKTYLSTHEYLIKVAQGYVGGTKALGAMLSKMTPNPDTYRRAGAQLKLLNDYLRMTNALYRRMDTIAARLHVLPRLVARVKSK